MKKFVVPVLIVFFLLCIMDFVINTMIMANAYKQIVTILRPGAEMNLSLVYLANIIHSIVLVSIYNLFAKKGVWSGLKLGILYGLGYGFGLGLGIYAMMPVTAHITAAWIVSCFVEFSIAGLVIGSMNK
ncbi:MAG: hypothetical protein NTY22_01180 [Proteobacteria bacterium]|nr:hypothetical protein [Pseudomonadota bacterium]